MYTETGAFATQKQCIMEPAGVLLSPSSKK